MEPHPDWAISGDGSEQALYLSWFYEKSEMRAGATSAISGHRGKKVFRLWRLRDVAPVDIISTLRQACM